ncbi:MULTISPECIES: L-arabinose ABC transporter [Campylobacter]|uniref:L-arabinose ABC transporter n=1 Tax=Campylobacter TaxID=194 RepID=UPI0014700904|nr:MULTISPECIES: L-arabinose ABC transporter [Campylobacter]MDU6826842.1 L-arabinose ABC transporter [Campylobacter sp.]
MCCFGVRVFLLMFITALSFILHRFYPVFPVIGYYLALANLLAFIMFGLFFSGLLPSFVKPGAVHYFSLIGGVLGAFLSMLFFRRLGRDKFNTIELCIFLFWLFLAATILLNFDVISMKFREILI